jgi:hypothetical protein
MVHAPWVSTTRLARATRCGVNAALSFSKDSWVFRVYNPPFLQRLCEGQPPTYRIGKRRATQPLRTLRTAAL